MGKWSALPHKSLRTSQWEEIEKGQFVIKRSIAEPCEYVVANRVIDPSLRILKLWSIHTSKINLPSWHVSFPMQYYEHQSHLPRNSDWNWERKSCHSWKDRDIWEGLYTDNISKDL